jgi:hypothetical protein
VTFRDLDDLVAFFEQFARDKQREFETGLLLRAHDLDDDIGDVIDGCRQWHDEQMAIWRVEFRRQLSELPFVFPLTVRFSGFDARASRISFSLTHKRNVQARVASESESS